MYVDWLSFVLVVAAGMAVHVIANLGRPILAARSLRRHLAPGEAVVSVRSVGIGTAVPGRRWQVFLAAPAFGRMRLRRSVIPGYELFLGVTGVEPAVRTPTGWEGMVVSATGDRVVQLGTQYGTVEVALPEVYVDWFRAQLSWQVAPPRH